MAKKKKAAKKKKQPKKKAFGGARRHFSNAKIGGRYRHNLKTLREIKLSGLSQKSQAQYLRGTVRTNLIKALDASENGRITVTFNYASTVSAKSGVAWGDPSMLSSESDIDKYIADAIASNSKSWEDSAGSDLSPGIQVLRVNTVAGKVFKKRSN